VCTAIAILYVGRVNDGVHQPALCIDEDMTLLAFDILACIVARQIVRPPFYTLLTLRLSMMAAVGLASREACSRHAA
jgi:hypothetical protein